MKHLRKTEAEDSICIGCGFCCDGTLHDHTDLRANSELAALAAGLPVESQGGSLIFRQPCPKFGCGRCAIYNDRPEPCRGYRCKLRKDLDEGQITVAEAREKIEIAKALVAKIKELRVWRGTPAERAALWGVLEKDLPVVEGEERERKARAVLSFAALDLFLERWFRRKDSA